VSNRDQGKPKTPEKKKKKKKPKAKKGKGRGPVLLGDRREGKKMEGHEGSERGERVMGESF